MGLQLVRSLLLTRLLYPEAFGLMALINVVLVGLKLCSDVGIEAALIQSDRTEDERFVQTAWTIGIGRGLLLALAAAAAAPVAAGFFGEPELCFMLPVAALGLIISPFGSLVPVIHRRRLEIGKVTIFGILHFAGDMIITIAYAVVLRSVWALILGNLTSSLLATATGHLAFKGVTHRLRWHRDSARHLFRFGSWVFISTLLTFLGQNSSVMVLGHLVDAEVLGIVTIATVLSSMPVRIAGGVAEAVLFPAASEIARIDKASLADKIRRAREPVFHLAIIVGSVVAFVSPLFFELLYDTRYHDAGWIARLLVFGAWFYLLQSTSSPILLSMADTRMMAFVNFVKASLTIGGQIAGYYLGGLIGFILMGMVGWIAAEALSVWKLRRWSVDLVGQDIASSVMFVAFAATGAGIDFALTRFVTEPWTFASRTGGAMLFSVSVVMILGWPYFKLGKQEIQKRLRKRSNRRTALAE